MPADNAAQAPANAAPATPADKATTEAPASAESVETLKQQLAREAEARKKAESNYSQLRSAYNQRDGEIARLRRQATAPAYAQPDDPYVEAPAAPSTDIAELDAIRADLAITRFRQETPDWQEHWSEVNDILSDPVRVNSVATYRSDGRVDYQGTVKRAYSEVKLARLEKLQQEAAAARAAAEQAKQSNRAQAFISGEGAGELPADLDISKMTADEMLAKGLVSFDESDPPEYIRRQRRGR